MYELKVPLQRADGIEYAVGAKPGALIAIGLETPKWEGPSFAERMGGMMGGGGMGGGGMGGGGGRGGGGGGGGRGGGGGGRGGEPAKPMNAWALVQLASQ